MQKKKLEKAERNVTKMKWKIKSEKGEGNVETEQTAQG